jgi:NPCBM/NEW2 domain
MRSLFIFIFICVVLVAPHSWATEVTVQPLSGDSFTTELVSINAEQLQFKNDSLVKSRATSELLSVVFNDQAIPQTTPFTLLMHNGSYLLGTHFQIQDGQVEWTLLSTDKLSIPVSHIKAMQLQPVAPDLQTEWQRYVNEVATLDRLVIRKKNDLEDNTGAAPFSLDVLEGVVQEIQNEIIVFENDGEILRVKREKVAGVIYRQRALTTPPPFVVVVDIDNSRWACSRLELNKEHCLIFTPENIPHKIPLNRMRLLDFSTINMRYLSASLIESEQRENILHIKHSQSRDYLPCFDRSPAGPLYVQGKLCEHGVWMPATSQLTLRIPDNFTRFAFTPAYDDNLENSDGATLLIETDVKKLHEEWIPRDQTTKEFILPLQSAKRLRITVKPGGTSYIGDTMVLREARFLP